MKIRILLLLILLTHSLLELEPDNFIEFDFLGKDSIRYLNRVKVDEQVR